jgi:pimeloyl-ACP methyl ester carboxylesterase
MQNQAEQSIADLIELTIERFNGAINKHLVQHNQSKIKIDSHYSATQKYFGLAQHYRGNELTENAKAVLFLTSAGECILNLAHLYVNAELKQLGTTLSDEIHNVLRTSRQLYNAYLQVTISTEMTTSEKLARRLSTGIRFSTSSMVLAPFIDPLIVVYAADTNHRNNVIVDANEQVWIGHDHTHFQHRVYRFRLNTEHGQSINIFRAEISKGSADTEKCLYVISIHGNAAYAAGDLSARMTEMDNFLAKYSAERVMLLIPDLPGSVASGGSASSLEEISQNSVQRIVHHLLQQGIDPATIVVRGYSLGGLISAHAVHTLKTQHGIEVSLISVDSLAQIRQFVSGDVVRHFVSLIDFPRELQKHWPKFLPMPTDPNHFAGQVARLADYLTPIAGKLALNHFDAPAFKLFDELDPHRRFCIHKLYDEIIPPKISVMFNLPGNEISAERLEVKRKDCILITQPNFGHGDDLITLKVNPCLGIYKRLYSNRALFQQKLFYQLVEKVVDGIDNFNDYCQQYTTCSKIGQNSISQLAAFIESLLSSDLKSSERLQAILGWVIHHNNEAIIEYKNARTLFNPRPPFLDFCKSIIDFADNNGALCHLMGTQESKEWCVALYQGAQPASNNQPVPF